MIFPRYEQAVVVGLARDEAPEEVTRLMEKWFAMARKVLDD